MLNAAADTTREEKGSVERPTRLAQGARFGLLFFKTASRAGWGGEISAAPQVRTTHLPSFYEAGRQKGESLGEGWRRRFLSQANPSSSNNSSSVLPEQGGKRERGRRWQVVKAASTRSEGAKAPSTVWLPHPHFID